MTCNSWAAGSELCRCRPCYCIAVRLKCWSVGPVLHAFAARGWERVSTRSQRTNNQAARLNAQPCAIRRRPPQDMRASAPRLTARDITPQCSPKLDSTTTAASFHEPPQPSHIQGKGVRRQPGRDRQQRRACGRCDSPQLPLRTILCEQQAGEGHHLRAAAAAANMNMAAVCQPAPPHGHETAATQASSMSAVAAATCCTNTPALLSSTFPRR